MNPMCALRDMLLPAPTIKVAVLIRFALYVRQVEMIAVCRVIVGVEWKQKGLQRFHMILRNSFMLCLMFPLIKTSHDPPLPA